MSKSWKSFNDSRSVSKRGLAAAAALALTSGIALVAAPAAQAELPTCAKYLQDAPGDYKCKVPVGAVELNYAVAGGKGGDRGEDLGGFGANIYGTMSVTPGQVLDITVGGNGADGTNVNTNGVSSQITDNGARGAGGGGYSSVALNGTPLVVAGGGGGAGDVGPGGNGGSTGSQGGGQGGDDEAGEDGGTASTGAVGHGGDGGNSGQNGKDGKVEDSCEDTAAGGGGFGANGGTVPGITNSREGGHGGGGNGSLEEGGGGGGYGGGGGGLCYGSGGGGSSLVPSGANADSVSVQGVVSLTVTNGALTAHDLSPKKGSSAGGAKVTIKGTNFVDGKTTVTIGGVPCAPVDIKLNPAPASVRPNEYVANGDELSCTPGKRAAGTVDVEITSDGKTITLPKAYTYEGSPAQKRAQKPESTPAKKLSSSSLALLLASAPKTNAGQVAQVSVKCAPRTRADMKYCTLVKRGSKYYVRFNGTGPYTVVTTMSAPATKKYNKMNKTYTSTWR